jgi:hypothetical protein
MFVRTWQYVPILSAYDIKLNRHEETMQAYVSKFFCVFIVPKFSADFDEI